MSSDSPTQKTVVVVGDKNTIDHYKAEMAKRKLVLIGEPRQLDENRWRAEFKRVKDGQKLPEQKN
mgnify:CR=1 FL=1